MAKSNQVKLILEKLEGGGYHLFINSTINGKRCRLLVDTGASKTVLDKLYFEKHFAEKKVRTIKQETTGLHTSVSKSYTAKLDSLKIGNTETKNYSAALVDLTHVNSTYGKLKKRKIQGILGSDILLKYKMVIDYGTLLINIP
jgi:predicted aspartyl protease